MEKPLCIVRPMEMGDIEEVSEIDQQSFPTLWPPTSYKRELENNLAKYIVACRNSETPLWGEGQNNPAPGKVIPKTPKPDTPLTGLRKIINGVRCLFIPEKTIRRCTSQRILGFAGMWFMADEAHLTTIAVLGEYRRRGIGELLLISSIDLAVQSNAKVVSLEVRVSNLVAQALYRKYGFNKVGVRTGYYTDNKEDALIMTTDPITSASYQGMFQRNKREYQQKWGACPPVFP